MLPAWANRPFGDRILLRRAGYGYWLSLKEGCGVTAHLLHGGKARSSLRQPVEPELMLPS